MKPLSLLIILCFSASLWSQNPCKTSLGSGQVICHESDNNGHTELYILDQRNVRQVSLDIDGSIINETNLGVLAYDSVWVDNNQIVKKLANGTEAYRKDIPSSLLAQIPNIEAVGELEDGSFILTGFQKFISPNPNPYLTIDSLMIIKTDPSLNVIATKKVFNNSYNTAVALDKVFQVIPLPGNAFALYYQTARPFLILTTSQAFLRFDEQLEQTGLLFYTGTTFNKFIRTPCGNGYQFYAPGDYYYISQKSRGAGTVRYEFDLLNMKYVNYAFDFNGSTDYVGDWISFGYIQSTPDSVHATYFQRIYFDPPPTSTNIQLINTVTSEVDTITTWRTRFDQIIRNSPNTALILDQTNGQLSIIDPICENAQTGIDLELSMTSDPEKPELYKNQTFTLRIENNGNEEATNVRVFASQPDGTVFQGGNEYIASQGTYHSNQEWNVGTIPAGGFATLQLNLFVLDADLPMYTFAQVLAADQRDVDSSPNNGTCGTSPQIDCSANEDDEIFFALNVVDIELDITASSLNVSNGDLVTITLSMTNKGPARLRAAWVEYILPSGWVVESFSGTGGWSSQEPTWFAPDIAPGATISGNLHVRVNNVSGPETIYAQVIRNTYDFDLDGTLNNGTCCTPVEDDEAAIEINSSLALPDLVTRQFQETSVPQIGGDMQVIVDINNDGAGDAGFFSYEIYISNDNVISSDDDLVYTNGWTGVSAGSNVTATVPVNYPNNLAPGNYHAILKIDSNNDVTETNEQNNTGIFTFRIQNLNCTGDIVLTSQAEVDAFGPCVIYDGNIKIDGLNITNVRALAGLEQVTGRLAIGATSIQNLDGLESLRQTWDFHLVNNDNLTEISALSNLRTAQREFQITYNDQLTNLNGLNNLNTVGNLTIAHNNALQNFRSLTGLVSCEGRLSISYNPNLLTLDGLQNLSSSVAVIEVVDNSSLVSIAGFKNITAVTNDFYLINAGGLVSLFGLEKLSRVNGVLSIKNNPLLENVNALSQLTELGGRLDLINNASLINCCGLFPLLHNNPPPNIEIYNNPNGCSSLSDLLATCQGTGNNIDLELTMTGSSPNVAIYQNYSYTLTVRNNGNTSATDVLIRITEPNDIVYQGGNEFIASTGIYNTFVGNWHINSIPPQGEETITINLFTLANTGTLTAFAEVLNVNETDSDSSPGNGTCCTPNEDDEAAFTAFFGGAPTLPDLTLANLSVPTSGSPGDVVDYNFDLKNIGNSTASGAYLIEAYISTDNQFSTDDAFGGEVPTGNTPVGTIPNVPGAITVPALPPGDYFFILVADVDQDIDESNENNNVLVTTFRIEGTPGNCSGDIVLISQAEVDAFGPCTVYDGNIEVKGFDITNLNAFTGLRQVNGDLRLDNLNNLEDLDGLENLEVITGYFEISDNFNGTLDDISALSNLRTVSGALDLRNLPVRNLNGLQNLESVGSLIIHDLAQIRNLDELGSLTTIANLLNIFSCDQLANINGLRQVSDIGNSIDIRANSILPTLAPLQNVSGNLGGYLIIWANSSMVDLNGLQNITGVNTNVTIFNNWELQNIDGLQSLTYVGGEFRLNSNRGLADCCGAYPLLSTGTVGGTIFIDNNAACNSVNDILTNCAPQGGVDIELSINGPDNQVHIYNFTIVTVEVSNTGNEDATGLQMNFGWYPQSGAVYAGGDEAIVSQGIFIPANNSWQIDNLDVGATASIDIKLFLLTGDPVFTYAHINRQDQADIDSEAGNFICAPFTNCPALEDDEDTWIINDTNNNIRSSIANTDHFSSIKTLVVHSVYPNPATETVFIDFWIKEDMEQVPARLYDTYGKIVFAAKQNFTAGQNRLKLDLRGLPSGLYHVLLETGHRHEMIRLVKQRF